MRGVVAGVVLICLAWPAAGSAQQTRTASEQPLLIESPSSPQSAGVLADAQLPPRNKDAGSPLAIVDPEPVWARPAVERMKDGSYWPTVWGLAGVPLYLGGNRMAPNGVAFDPIFALDLDFNIGLYNVNKVYLYVNSTFWAESAMAGVTNDKQGHYDFSKREFDLAAGVACNYWDRWEARVYAYSFNNINRGTGLDQPFGFKDGVGLENRYYLGNLFFDVARRSFVAVGYLPTRELMGADGDGFRPSVYARMQLAHDLIPEKLFVSLDSQFTCQRPLIGRLLWFDAGISTRPFSQLPGLEFRAGSQNNYDMEVDIWRELWYLAVRFVF